MGHTSGGFHGHHPPGYSPLINGGLSRPPPPGPASFHSPAHFPAQLVYWPGCGYPSPPISPNNYYMTTPGPATPTPSSLLTPTSSISSLSNGVTSPGPGHSSPPLASQQNTLLTVETVTPVKFVRGAMPGPGPGPGHQERHNHNNQSLLRSSVYIH